MIFALCIGVMSAFVILIAMWRCGIDRFMGYPAVMDVLVTVVLIWMLHGSYVGMVAAIIGGLTFSAIITVLRKTRGYDRLTIRGWKHTAGTLRIENPLNKLKQRKWRIQCSPLNLHVPPTAYIVALLILVCAL